MKFILKNFKLLTVFLFVIGLTSCSDDDNNPPTTTTVVDVAVANGFTSLAAALQATDLVSVLQGPGPFTVFAPTNDAFTDLLNTAQLDLNNLSTAEEELVRQILLNHVIVGSELDATAITSTAPSYRNTGASGVGNTNLSLFYNVNGSTVQLNGGSSTTAGANVTATNVEADNGVIHVIDKVLGLPTVVDMALANPDFSSLVGALTTSTPGTDFVTILSTENGTQPAPFTILAPNNAAFAALTATPSESELVAILQHHVIDGNNVQSSNLNQNGDTMPETLEGDLVTITLPGTNGNIANVTDGSGNSDIGIIAVDVQTTNGVIHVVNKVLIPNTTN
ncbi:fasciclin domain-containing protein [Winogradskyella litorisediminis]|uniref:Fasciclin domain-containing protein n=1 Tax=Winogradskyella litorisediminis TaxID=1156618 RepID=A0ABW3N9D8_9FLAO